MKGWSGGRPESWTQVGDGTRLFTRRWRAQDAVASLLLVHGLGDHSGRYRELARRMTAVGISVTAFDLRGHGRSPGRRGDAPSMDLLLSDIEVMGDRSREGVDERAPWFLFGHSMGGLLALLYAVELEPDVGGLVVSAPWLANGASVPRWKERLGRILLKVAPGWGIGTGLEAEELSRDPQWVRAYREDPLVHQRISPRLYEIVGRAQERVLAGELNLPSLFLVPGDDSLVDGAVSREMAEREGASLRVFPDFRHEGFGEMERESFFRALLDWLVARLRPAGD